ncbi:MAG: hypothetical protein K5686_07770 [Lachnospiraceae bacterium]|nr:hypothetical protein [Lachnospiraceae bacterium]
MKAFKEDKKQQERLKKFYKEETTYFPNHVLLNFCAVFLTVISFLINIIPCLEYGDGYIKIALYGCLLYSIGISTYASKYAAFTEPLTKKLRNIVELTKYLPVNRMQLTIYRIKKILKPCLITTALVIALRLLISFGVHGTATVWDVLIPFGLMIVWPVLIELMRY